MSDEAASPEYLHVRQDVKRRIQKVHEVRAFSRRQEGLRRATAVKAHLARAKAPRVWWHEVDELFLKRSAELLCCLLRLHLGSLRCLLVCPGCVV